MATYKFRVMYEEDDNLFRDIEIKSSQNFIEFEEAIIKAWGLPPEAETSFYESNDRAQKVKQINYRKSFKKDGALSYPVIMMFVNNPHQKFLYHHEGKQELIFFIELIQIGQEKSGTDYPLMIKTNGPSPVRKEDIYKHIKAHAIEVEESEGIDEDDEARMKDMGFEGEDDVHQATDESDDETIDENEEQEEDESDDSDDEIGDMFKFDNDGGDDDRY